MSGFSAHWLHLREPFDRAARAAAAAVLDLPALGGLRGEGGALAVIDLACGTGANLRELAPRLGGRQRWQLVDHDPALLEALAPALAAWARANGHRFAHEGDTLQLEGHGAGGLAFSVELRRVHLDLARDSNALPFDDAQLVTASALLDLVSAAWLQALVERAARSRCALLFALNVDGRSAWAPPDEDDGLVGAFFAAHQCRDKGFGPALGEHAVAQAVALLQAAGYRVRQAASDWVIDMSTAAPASAAAALQRSLIDGMAAAALEQAPRAGIAIRGWQQRRLALHGRSCLRVGHMDLMVLP